MSGPSRHIPRLRVRLSVLGVLVCTQVVACGGQKEAEAPRGLTAEDDPDEQLAAPPIETVQAPITHLERSDVDSVIDAGVARFIQGFDMMEQLDEYDRFVGWKIGKIYDRDRFDGLGIGAGDVITSINGMPLERPAHVYEVLMSLKTAKSVDVEYLRGGRVMRLSLPIIGEPAKKEPAGSEAKAAPSGEAKGQAKDPSDGSKKASGPASNEKKKSED